jgi:aldehyde dehydrogenase family 7 protein A1
MLFRSSNLFTTSIRPARFASYTKMTVPVARPLSSRAAAVLKALDLPTDGQPISGVYDGAWGGSGPVVETTCPATGEVLARVITVSALGCQSCEGEGQTA